MKFETNILSKQTEKLIRSLYQKKYRIQHNLCICEGLRACKELYSSRPDLILFGVTIKNVDISSFNNINFYKTEPNTIAKLSSTINTQGIMLIAKIPTKEKIVTPVSPFALVLDNISDPGNFGTILRTCASVGLKDIWYSTNCADPYSEKTIRAALASQFTLNLIKYKEINSLIEDLRNLRYGKVFRSEPSEGHNCFYEEKLFEKSIIIFGNEARGIKEVNSSVPINIPMPGKFESLNVAQAVTVILFDAVRRGVL